MAIPIAYYLVLSAILFSIGVGAFLIKRNIITVFMSIELMLNAVNLTFVAFAYQWHRVQGQIFVFFVMVVAAAEAAVGLAIIIAIFRAQEHAQRGSSQPDETMNPTPSLHLWLIPVLPFLGFLLNGLLGRRLPKAVVSTIALLFTAAPLAMVTSIALQFSGLTLPYVERLSTPWMATSVFRADFSFQLDQLTLIMLLVVTGVGFLIHIYSVGYMAHEDGYWRFFAYLNLFMFFMLTLVLAENFLLMFVGWEGVGLASYLLIGFYYLRTSAADAGKKAFILNRVGDFGFLLAMFLMIAHFGSLSYATVFGAISQHTELQGGFLTAIALLMVLGATGKSAQIPLYIWLPDAMEGPTPVSALIHAATMVTAGVYMVVRSHVLFDRSPFALGVVAIIGASHRFVRGHGGHRANRYQTGAGLLHHLPAWLHVPGLRSGGLFSSDLPPGHPRVLSKGLLFLAAGSVIHALGGSEQDMRAMGGLRKKIPVTFWTMSAGVFAISGLPPFAGFFSKDAILYQAFQSPYRRTHSVVCRPGDGPAHLVLHVPALVPHVLWREPNSRCSPP